MTSKADWKKIYYQQELAKLREREQEHKVKRQKARLRRKAKFVHTVKHGKVTALSKGGTAVVKGAKKAHAESKKGKPGGSSAYRDWRKRIRRNYGWD